MVFLSNYKITHKLTVMGLVSISVAIILSAAFQYSFYIENKIHQKELLLHNAFEKVWEIQANALKLSAIERDLFKGGNLEAKALFDNHQKLINEDIGWLEDFFSSDKKALELIGFVKTNQNNYSNTVQEIVDEYKANGLRPVTNIISYMPDAKLIALKLKALNVPDKVMLKWLDSRRHELFFFGDRSPDILPDYYASMEGFRQSLSALPASEDKQRVVELLDSHEGYFVKVSEVFKSVWVKEETLSDIVNNYKYVLEALKVYSEGMLLTVKEDVAETQKTILISFYALLLISVALLGACLLFIVKNVRQSTSEVKDILHGIAMGDAKLNERLPEIGKNEMSEVAHWFNHLMDKLQEAMKDVGKLSCDLTAVAFSAQKKRDATSSVFEGQVDRVDNIASLITGMDDQVLQTTNHAKEAANSAAQANENASSGAKVVSSLIHSMNSLATNIEETSQVVIALDEHAKTINTVITMIEQVAEQTNLLALNAAIEAARAGEAGRGFAVVADEVRNLSMRTTESTQEIHKTIAVLQQSTQQVVDAMMQNREQANAGVQLANEADASLNSITESVGSIDRLNEQMLGATLENQKAIHQITTDFAPVRAAIDDLSRETKRSISDSADLTQTAAVLQSVTASFGMVTVCEIDLESDNEPDCLPPPPSDPDDVELF